MDMQEVYERGWRVAEERCGDECREFDRVLWGIRELLTAGGMDVENSFAVADMWHTPLAGVKTDLPIATVVGMMDWEAKRLLGSRMNWEAESIIHHKDWWYFETISREAWGPEMLTRVASDEIQRQFKQKYPGKRVNSKFYREIYEGARERFEAGYRKMQVEKVQQRLEQLDARFEKEVAKRLNAVSGATRRYRRLAQCLRILESPTETADGLEKRADEYEDGERKYRAWYDAQCAELQGYVDRGGLPPEV